MHFPRNPFLYVRGFGLLSPLSVRKQEHRSLVYVFLCSGCYR
jgi:hypothetical protein